MPFQNSHHSQQTKEIMGKAPSWVIRWGMLVIFIILFGIIIGCCIIKYPQIITAPVSITTINPPSDMIAKSTGKIDSLFAKDGDILRVGQPVALLFNTANYDDVEFVYRSIQGFNIDSVNLDNWVDGKYRMGELQGIFAEFNNLYKDYRYYIQANNIPKKQDMLRRQVSKNKSYLLNLRFQKTLQDKDFEYTHKNHIRDSLLYIQGVISASEFEASTQLMIQKKGAIAGFEASITTAEINVMQMEQQIIEIGMQHDDAIATYRRQISEKVGQLTAQIHQWYDTYLLSTPINGKLSFSRYWSKNQNVLVGEKVASVVPADPTRVIGIMTVPSVGFGKVAVGQKVNIRLSGYPYMEYGVLKGTITRMSSVPEYNPTYAVQGQQSSKGNVYIAEVAFPDGMQTSYREHLKLIQHMDGEGDIITKDQRLIERFIQPIRALFDKISD